MNEKDSEQTNPTHNSESSPSNAVVHQQQENADNKNPQHQPSNKKLHNAISRLWHWAREDWGKTEFTQRVELGLAVIVAAATITYVVVASRQLGAMNKTNRLTQDSLNNAKNQFRQDQRPYIWIANGNNNPAMVTFKNTSQIAVTITYTNFGKSPAVDLQGTWDIETGIDAYQKIKTRKHLSPPSGIVPTGKEDFFTAVTPALTGPEVAADLNIPFGGVVVFARWQYLDLTRHRYETELCLSRNNSGTWRYCSEHSKTKDCSEVTCEP
jgi:hypothetical protein